MKELGPVLEANLCSACDDDGFLERGEADFRPRKANLEPIFASEGVAWRKPNRSSTYRIIRWVFASFGDLSGRIRAGFRNRREVAFYRAGRLPFESRTPDEILVSFEAIIEVHRGVAVRKRSKS